MATEGHDGRKDGRDDGRDGRPPRPHPTHAVSGSERAAAALSLLQELTKPRTKGEDPGAMLSDAGAHPVNISRERTLILWRCVSPVQEKTVPSMDIFHVDTLFIL